MQLALVYPANVRLFILCLDITIISCSDSNVGILSEYGDTAYFTNPLNTMPMVESSANFCVFTVEMDRGIYLYELLAT